MLIEIRHIILWMLLCMCAQLYGQQSYYRVFAKVDSSGVLRSRVATFDSLEVMNLRDGKLTYQLWKGTRLIRTKNLVSGSLADLERMAKTDTNYYLQEINSIMTDPEQPLTIKESYSILTFLSFFNGAAGQWLGQGTRDTVTAGSYEVRYLLSIKGRKPKIIGSAKIHTDDWKKKPIASPTPTLDCGNRSVSLTLNAKACKGYYLGFNTQRRMQGTGQWQFISPVISVNPYYETKYGDGRYLHKMQDSLPENHVTYEYRIVGMDYFGDYGTPGSIVECTGIEPYAGYVVPLLTTMKNDSLAELNWEIKEEYLPEVKSIDLLVSLDSLYGHYIVFVKSIDLQKRSVTVVIPEPYASFRYRINTIYGQEALSSPFDVERWDTRPPAAPTDLTGKIDTMGIVRLKWKVNSEKDLWGYRVFFANNKTDEFSLCSAEIMSKPFFIDTIKLDNLSAEIYYKIVALDQRGNISPFSKILTITKPDTIPPAPAFIKVIKQFKNTSTVLLRAVGGGSQDLSGHKLYRRDTLSDTFVELSQIGVMTADTVLIDTTAEFGHYYEYKILASDKSRNTRWSPIREIDVLFMGLRPKLSEVEALRDTANGIVRIKWQPEKVQDCMLEFYRTNEKGNYSTYRSIEGESGMWEDKYKGAAYTPAYRLKVLYPDGTYSAIFEVPIKEMPINPINKEK